MNTYCPERTCVCVCVYVYVYVYMCACMHVWQHVHASQAYACTHIRVSLRILWHIPTCGAFLVKRCHSYRRQGAAGRTAHIALLRAGFAGAACGGLDEPYLCKEVFKAAGMHVCIMCVLFLCAYVYMYVCIYTHTYTYTHTHKHTHTHVCVYIYTHTQASMYTFIGPSYHRILHVINVCVCMYMYVYIYIHTYIRMHIHTNIYWPLTSQNTLKVSHMRTHTRHRIL
jgi:hypothetical protein